MQAELETLHFESQDFLGYFWKFVKKPLNLNYTLCAASARLSEGGGSLSQNVPDNEKNDVTREI